MEILSIECTTCGSRLKVRDPSLIGQIISCPKCGGMVEVAAPPTGALHPGPPETDETSSDSNQKISVGPDGTVDSQALTQESLTAGSFTDGAEQGSDAESPSGRLPGPDEFSAGPVFDDEGLPPQTQADENPAEPSRLDAAAFAQSAASRKTRQVAMISALSFVGLVVSVIAFTMFVQWWQAEENGPAVAENSPAADPSASDASDSPPPSLDPDSAATNAPEPDGSAADAGDPLNQDPTVPAAPDLSPLPPETMPAEGTDPITPPAATAAVPTPAEPTNPEEMPATETPAGDQALLDSMIGNPVLGANDAPATAANNGQELPEELKRWTNIFSVDQDRAANQTNLPAPPTLEQVELDMPAIAAASNLEAVEQIEVESWLERRLAADPQPAPLVRWVQLLSQLSSVPIGIDMVSLDAAGIDPLQPVTPPSGWTTASAILDNLTAQLGCEAERKEHVVVIRAPDAAIQAALAPALLVDDLIDPPNDAASANNAFLESAVRRLADAPTARLVLDEKPRIEIEGASSPQLWMATLTLESVRLARKLPPRLPPARSARWLVSPDAPEWPPIEGQKSIAPLDQPRSAIDLLVEISQANGALPLINWSDALPRGLAPSSGAMPWLAETDGKQAVHNLLDPYQLKAWDVGNGLWWIGSETTYDVSEVFAYAPLDPSKSRAILERMAASLDVPSADALHVAVDPTSKHLISRTPRFIARQIPKLITP